MDILDCALRRRGLDRYVEARDLLKEFEDFTIDIPEPGETILLAKKIAVAFSAEQNATKIVPKNSSRKCLCDATLQVAADYGIVLAQCLAGKLSRVVAAS